MPHPVPGDPATRWDVGVVVSFGYFLTAAVLDSFAVAAINVHPSLLPRYRGGAPIQHTITNGDRESGVSIIELHRTKWDAGRILKQSLVPVPDGIEYQGLMETLARQGAEDLLDTLRNLEAYTAKAATQPAEGGVKAPRITAQMGHLAWDRLTAPAVDRLRRGVGHQVSLFTGYHGLRVVLKDLLIPGENLLPLGPSSQELSGAPPGAFFLDQETKPWAGNGGVLWIKCAEGTAVGVTELQVDGRKVLTPGNFVNGYVKKRPGSPHVFEPFDLPATKK